MSGALHRLRWFAAGFACLGLPSVAFGAPCPMAGEATARIVAVEPRLELRLADGHVLRLAGLDPAQPTPAAPDLDETARVRLAAKLAGKAVTWQALAGIPDRWGRIPALVFPVDGAAVEGGVSTVAISAGLGRYLAEPLAKACRETLVAAEAKARDAKLGLWADPYYAVLDVDDSAGFAERSATVVLAEGLLLAVAPGPYRTTLRFARPGPTESAGRRFGRESSGPGSFGGHMLVATILPRTMKIFAAQKIDLEALVGRRLRVRGLLDLRFGPRIELTGPDDIETIAAPREGTAAPHSN